MVVLSRRMRSIRANLLAGSVIAAAFATGAQALPTGGAVAAGAATITAVPSQLTVRQSTQNAVINWQSFGIGLGEGVTFVQPNSNSVALNRVLGQDQTAILGSLTANGKVFIVNPNGVLFGQGAQVNVAGLVASSLGITDSDFMAGRYSFTGSGGSVVNRGSIVADGGTVVLLGAQVSNSGLIAARLGSVALVAGTAATLDFGATGLLTVTVDRGAVDALADNGGMIVADGGTVLMTARGASGLLKTAVNNSGVIQARSIGTRNGSIMLLGDATNGVVSVGGTLDASGTAAATTGGTIVATGNAVAITGTVDASGSAGGGSIALGGGYRGRDPAIANAATVSMAAGATVTADAVTSGNGGRVVLWSTGATEVAGTISARGGSVSGAGGLVETSGAHVTLADSALVRTTAAHGSTGLWLLDPVDYLIATAGGDETPSQVTLSLANSNRLIIADHNITVADAVTWTTPQTLELRAGNDVLINAAVTASTAGSKFIITAGHNAELNAAITASALGSQININAGQDINQNQAITASAGGSVLLVADSDGSGGLTGGTVHLSSLFPVTSTSKTIYYSPEHGYGAPNDYTGFTAYMWVFVAAKDKIYDGTTPAVLTFRGDPTVGGAVDVRLSGGTGTFDNANVGTLKPVTFTGAGLAGADQARYALFAAAGVTTASITPAPLIVTANNASKIYGDTLGFSGSEFTSTGLVNGETIGSVTEVSPGTVATASVAGSPYAITPSNAIGGSFSASNYTTTYVNGVLTVAAAPLTITANNASKTYGQTVAFSGSEFTSSGLRNGDVVGVVTLASPGAAPTASVAGSPYAITPSGGSGGSFVPTNYVVTYVNGTLAISPAALLITANPTSKVYGDALTYTGSEFTASGLQNGETVGSATLTSAGAAATAGVAGGPYPVTVAGAVGGSYTPANYSTTYVGSSLTVTPATLVVTANSTSKVAGTTLTFAGTEFTSTGLKNGDTIVHVDETSAGATSTATPSSTTYAIVASNATGGSYSPTNYTTSYTDGALTVTAAASPTPTPTPIPTPTPVGGGGTGGTGGTGGGSGGTGGGGAGGGSGQGAQFAGGGLLTDTPTLEALAAGSAAVPLAVTSSALPAGVQFAVLGGGVRVPTVQFASTTPQAAVPYPTPVTPAVVPAAPAAAPAMRPRKQDRN